MDPIVVPTKPIILVSMFFPIVTKTPTYICIYISICVFMFIHTHTL